MSYGFPCQDLRKKLTVPVGISTESLYFSRQIWLELDSGAGNRRESVSSLSIGGAKTQSEN